MNGVFATNTRQQVTKLIVIFYSFSKYFVSLPPFLTAISVSVKLIY